MNPPSAAPVNILSDAVSAVTAAWMSEVDRMAVEGHGITLPQMVE